MYFFKNKISLLSIITLFTTNINALNIKVTELSPGDIININYWNNESIEKYGDIFNGNNSRHFIEVKVLPGSRPISVITQVCVPFNDLESYYLPKIDIDNEGFDLLNIYNNTSTDNVFDIKPDYIKGDYSYGIVKVCRITRKESLLSVVINQNDLPIVSNRINYKLLLDRTAILRFRQEGQTHYVSSIVTGECLMQVYINYGNFCRQFDESKIVISNFIASSESKSRVKSTSGDLRREKDINDFVTISNVSFLKLTELSARRTFYNVFEPISAPKILELSLKSLPKLPKKTVLQSILREELVTNIVPGDIINLQDLKRINSLIPTDNILVDVFEQITSPFSHFHYTQCHRFNIKDPVEVKFVPYTLHYNYTAESFYKFDVFEEIVKQKYYGVDPMYLSDNYEALKVKICSAFTRSKLIIPSVDVISLGKDDVNKFRIFENKNIVLRYAVGNETHYVVHTEKGNCLFQALIYENIPHRDESRKIERPLLFIGKILSANDDPVLEDWTRRLVVTSSMEHYKTLMSLINNQTVIATIYSKLSQENLSNVMINIYLDKLN